MKQRLLLIFVFCLFLLTWSSVVYQVFFKQQSSLIMNATDSAKVRVNKDFKKGIVTEEVALKKANGEKRKEVISKTQTEKNKEINLQLSKGLDFGVGISIDDLLKNLGIVIIN